ncbi:hypothetical protein ACRALDRAFT_2029958 [Sodiomyces alcalophilus JCM 7366]|uniref:uncharacterized protein n=1 Tax=Sodiomyces alcalophilus JCM 7366 TaxID=591952 RepID=UPI0039B3C99A
MVRTRRSRRAPSREPAAVTDSEQGQLPTSDNNDGIQDGQNLIQTRQRGRRTRAGANVTAAHADASHKTSLERTRGARDVAMRRLAAEDGPTSSSTNAARDSDESMDVSVEIGRKEHATPAQQQRRDTTGLDLDDSLFGSLEDSLMDDEPDAPPSGQRSTDTSTMNTSIFKRRGRAPSISLQGNEAPIRPSSRGGMTTPAISSSFNIGVFKRRAREPSILGTARKERAEKAIEIPSASSSDGQDEEEEEFAPEAESTPLNRRKTLQRSTPTGRLQEPGSPSPNQESRKRKSIEGHHDMGSPPDKISRMSEPDVNDARDDDDSEADAANSDHDADLSSLPSLPSPELPPLPMHRPSTPIDQEAIMAPPESSGSEEEENGGAWPDIRELAKRRRHHPPATPLHDDHVSDMSSPPSLTHSPNLRVTRSQLHEKKRPRRQSSPPVTTAALTDLLPRRRHEKNRDDGDSGSDSELDASGLGDDDDELTYLEARAARRRGRAAPLNRGAPPKAKPHSSTGTSSKPGRPRRTYRQRFSDKENEDGGEEESSITPAPDDTFDSASACDPSSSDQLKDAIEKFKEVDKWELAFEEITQSSSSGR